jgi:hypothetical protein
MPTHLDTQAVEQAARALLDIRMQAIRRLAATRQAKADAHAAAQAADREDAAAYSDALRQGWTEEELRKLDFQAPERKTPGRPRRRRTPAVRTAPTPTHDDPPPPSAHDADHDDAGPNDANAPAHELGRERHSV